MAVTKRQKQVLDFVAHFVEDNGYSPSYEEIARGLSVASMEGFLQGLKFENAEMQKHVFSLIGRRAKSKGAKKSWRRMRCIC